MSKEQPETTAVIELIADAQVDAIGLNCPLPLLKAKQGLNKLQAGQILVLTCTDPGSVRDFEVFARQSGHKLLRTEERDGHYCYWLEKKP
ncbi:MAG: tRNA 2-thiouridine synthesizing protein A [Candidatus Azotimanducaceae bacterium]|jgi:tRNA 2-thiouridine synthesizing protein A